MKTTFALGFASVATVVLVAACSGTPADVDYAADGAIITDGSTSNSSGDTGVPTGTGVGVGTGGTGTGSGTGTSGGGFDSGTPTGSGDSSTSGSDGGGGGNACPSTCSSDTDCQNQCPAISGAINCCDTVTNGCYMSATTECPDQMTSGGDAGGGGY